MEISTHTLIYSISGVMFVFMIFLFVFAFAARYIKLATNINRAPKNSALMFINDGNDELRDPIPVRMDKDFVDVVQGKETKTFYYSKDVFKGPKIFGRPFFIVDSNDSKVTSGLYYKQVGIKQNATGDKETVEIKGTFQYKDPATGNLETIKDYPLLLAKKNSVVNPPDLLRAVINTQALSKLLSEYIKNHKTEIYLMFGIIIGVAINLYLSLDYIPQKIIEACT